MPGKKSKERRNKLDIQYPYRHLKREKCEKCGVEATKGTYDKDGYLIRKNKAGRLQVHHIDEDVTNNNPKNLMTLCQSCHRRIHNNY